MSTPILRPYQSTMVTDIRDRWSAGARNVLAVLPTGGGKTVIMADILASHVGASCLIAHRSELVLQASMMLARYGLRHSIIAASDTKRAIAAEHIAELGQCFYTPGARCVVASVDTLVRQKNLSAWAQQVTLWVVDECFPAGTQIDGRAIETIRVGDLVTAFNEQTGTFEKRPVARLYKNPQPDEMMRIALLAHHVITCTKGHPFWTRRGWIAASNLTLTDEVLIYGNPCESTVPRVWSRRGFIRMAVNALEKNTTALLQRKMLQRISAASIVGNNDTNESQVLFGENDREQPHEKSGGSGKSVASAPKNETSTARAWWKREASDSSRGDACFTLWGHRIQKSDDCSSWSRTFKRLAYALQNRLRKRVAQSSNRSGRVRTFGIISSNKRPPKGRISYWHRLDRVEVYKSTDNDGTDDSNNDGYVYNIEVEGLHTYLAEGVVVHNCHHLVTGGNDPITGIRMGNKWHRAVSQFIHPLVHGLGPTATPTRADGKGLGIHHDGLMHAMVEGPSMRELIDDGYLTDYRLFCPASDLQVLGDVSASGDWSPDKLREASARSHIIGDVVTSYRQFANGLTNLTFTTDVDTAQKMAQNYRNAGIAAECITGDTDPGFRRQTFKRFERAEIKVVVTVDIVGEGTDIPACQSITRARPSRSEAVIKQQWGRGFRPIWPGRKEPPTRDERLRAITQSIKPCAILIDHTGATVDPAFGPPDRITVHTLDRRDKTSRGASDAIPLRVCITCFQPTPRHSRDCMWCGAGPPEPQSRSLPAHVDGDLVELDAATLERLRQGTTLLTVEQERERLSATGLPDRFVRANVKSHAERIDAQMALRDAMAAWAGPYHAAGESDSMIQRRFFHNFECDVLSACALNRADSEALRLKIDGTVNSA